MKEKNEFIASLPLFQGFYNTCFDVDWEEYERIVEDLIQKSEYLDDTPLSYGNFEFDNASYEHDIACKYIEEFKKYKPSYVKDIEMLRLIHPKEYNHRNDEIEVKFTLSDDFKSKMMDFMTSEEKWLRNKIKEDWSDRPGFWSFLSSNYNKWVYYIEHQEITQTNSGYYAALIGYNMLADNTDIGNILDAEIIEQIDLTPYIKCNYGK